MNESMVTFCRRPRNRVDFGHLKFEQLNLNNCTAFMGLLSKQDLFWRQETVSRRISKLSSNMTVLLEAWNPRTERFVGCFFGCYFVGFKLPRRPNEDLVLKGVSFEIIICFCFPSQVFILHPRFRTSLFDNSCWKYYIPFLKLTGIWTPPVGRFIL